MNCTDIDPLTKYWSDLDAFLSKGGEIDEKQPMTQDFSPEYSPDGQYLLMGRWALDKIIDEWPKKKIVDVGGDVKFLSFLARLFPIEHIDIRDPGLKVKGFTYKKGSITALPYQDNDSEIMTLTCLHVAEHIGLGRYGDEIDPQGFEKACAELKRVLAPGGRLYFAVPTGRPRVVFNAHRVLSSRQVMEAFSGLKLLEFSGIDSTGRYGRNIALDTLDEDSYGCGLWEFEKNGA